MLPTPWYYYFFDPIVGENAFSAFCSCAMIFGGVIPYIPQYREIRRTLNAEGFSLYVCFSLLVANILRIVFWFGHPFELPLLFQSIIMNTAMLAMIHLCVKVRHQTQLIPAKPNYFSVDVDAAEPESKSLHSLTSPRTFWDFNLRHFWEWTDFLSYVEFLAAFAVLSGIGMYLMVDVEIVVESLGYVSLFTEAMLGAPQFCRNFRKKSTLGMSRNMVLLWTIGDMFKVWYFLARNAPTQFWVCGSIQVTIDFGILLQVLYYRSRVGSLLAKEKHTS